MILQVKFSQDMCDTYPGELGNLMNRLRYRMELAEWDGGAELKDLS